MSVSSAKNRRSPLTAKLLPALALSTLGYFIWTYLETGSPPRFDYTDQSQQLRNTPEYFLEQIEGQQYDQHGQLALQFTAQAATHQPGDNSTAINQPQAQVYRNGQPHWTITAQSAIVSPTADQIELQRAVRISSADQQTVLQGELFTVLPKLQRVTSQQAVTVTSASGTLRATGLRAELEPRQIQLLNQVRGHYLAQP